MLAIEMPPGVAQLDAAGARLHNLLGAAVSGKRQVTNTRSCQSGSGRCALTLRHGRASRGRAHRLP
jgi:hypothetical protein